MWVWSLTAVAAEPRSALNAMVFPLSILLAMLLSDLARRMATRHQRMWEILFVVLTIYLFAESYLFSFRLVSASLTPDDRAAMEWVREHTPVESQFVLLTGVPAPELDSFQEWFPTLAERKSVTTFQGTEWTLGPRFFSNFKELKELQECVNAECLQAWIAESQISFDYVLVRKRNLSTELIISIRSDKKFETLYEDGVIVLFAQE